MTDLDQRLDIVSEWGRSAIGIDMIHLAKDAKAEIERLRTALRKYGVHTYSCALPDSAGKFRCDCGWQKIVDELNEQ